MDWKTFWMNAAIALIPVLVVFFTGLISVGITFLKSKINNDKVDAALSRLEYSIDTIIKSLSQTTVDAMKAKAADGKLTSEEIDEVRELFWDEFTAYWGPKGIEELKKILGLASDEALKKVTSHGVEAQLYTAKIQAGVIANKIKKA